LVSSHAEKRGKKKRKASLALKEKKNNGIGSPFWIREGEGGTVSRFEGERVKKREGKGKGGCFTPK